MAEYPKDISLYFIKIWIHCLEIILSFYLQTCIYIQLQINNSPRCPQFLEKILIIYSKIISKSMIYYTKSQYLQRNYKPQKK